MLEDSEIYAQIWALHLTSDVALGKILKLLMPKFPYLNDGNNIFLMTQVC